MQSALQSHSAQRTDRFMEFFEKAGLVNEDGYTAPEVWTSNEDVREAMQLDECFAQRSDMRPIVLVFPGVGSGPGKPWPPGRYVKLINHLTATYQARVSLGGSSHDQLLCRTIAAFVSPCKNLAGCRSVGALFALIRVADLVIAGDSGPIHVAGATGTSAVAIFGPTDPKVWAPCSAQLTILRRPGCPPCNNPYHCRRDRDFDCTRDVTVYDVIEACQRVFRPRSCSHDKPSQV